MTRKQTKKSLYVRIRQRLALLAVPHKANTYHPHLVRAKGLTVILVLVSGCLVASNFSATGDVLGQRTSITPDQLLAETNKAREWEGATSLKLNPSLNQAAYLKAQDMLTQQYWSHVSPSGTQPWKWITDSSYNYSQAGENLARGFTNSKALTKAWLASPEHRSNILDIAYRDVGFAVVEGEMDNKPTTLVVAFYGAPATTSVAGVSSFQQPISATGFVASLGRSVQALPAAAVGSIVILVGVAVVGLLMHSYRRHLPNAMRTSWRRHHGAYTAMGSTTFAIVIFIMYSGGQI